VDYAAEDISAEQHGNGNTRQQQAAFDYVLTTRPPAHQT
jgi:hypothetical protein